MQTCLKWQNWNYLRSVAKSNTMPFSSCPCLRSVTWSCNVWAKLLASTSAKTRTLNSNKCSKCSWNKSLSFCHLISVRIDTWETVIKARTKLIFFYRYSSSLWTRIRPRRAVHLLLELVLHDVLQASFDISRAVAVPSDAVGWTPISRANLVSQWPRDFQDLLGVLEHVGFVTLLRSTSYFTAFIARQTYANPSPSIVLRNLVESPRSND